MPLSLQLKDRMRSPLQVFVFVGMLGMLVKILEDRLQQVREKNDDQARCECETEAEEAE